MNTIQTGVTLVPIGINLLDALVDDKEVAEEAKHFHQEAMG